MVRVPEYLAYIRGHSERPSSQLPRAEIVALTTMAFRPSWPSSGAEHFCLLEARLRAAVQAHDQPASFESVKPPTQRRLAHGAVLGQLRSLGGLAGAFPIAAGGRAHALTEPLAPGGSGRAGPRNGRTRPRPCASRRRRARPLAPPRRSRPARAYGSTGRTPAATRLARGLATGESARTLGLVVARLARAGTLHASGARKQAPQRAPFVPSSSSTSRTPARPR